MMHCFDCGQRLETGGGIGMYAIAFRPRWGTHAANRLVRIFACLVCCESWERMAWRKANVPDAHNETVSPL